MLLVLRGRGNSVNRALDVAAGQEGERITSIHGERRILRLHPLPLARLVTLDLERSDGLAEEQSPGAEVGVAAAPETADLLVLLRSVLGVLHVPEVVLHDMSTRVNEPQISYAMKGYTSLLRSYR